MLGLVLIYFIGKRFYDLAITHQKSPHLFGVLGVVSYYAGTFILGFVLVLLLGVDAIEEMDQLFLGLAALPAGLLSCYIFYKVLENSWNKTQLSTHTDILDDFDD